MPNRTVGCSGHAAGGGSTVKDTGECWWLSIEVRYNGGINYNNPSVEEVHRRAVTGGEHNVQMAVIGMF